MDEERLNSLTEDDLKEKDSVNSNESEKLPLEEPDLNEANYFEERNSFEEMDLFDELEDAIESDGSEEQSECSESVVFDEVNEFIEPDGLNMSEPAEINSESGGISFKYGSNVLTKTDDNRWLLNGEERSPIRVFFKNIPLKLVVELTNYVEDLGGSVEPDSLNCTHTVINQENINLNAPFNVPNET